MTRLTATAMIIPALMASAGAGAQAPTPGATPVAIQVQALSDALHAFSVATGQQVIASAPLLRGKRSSAVQDIAQPQEALAQLLAGTGLAARSVGETFVIEADGASGANGDIVVTGSRIRGAPVTSPVVTVSREQALRTGITDLGQLIRTLPQNFNGGQNPSVAGAGAQGDALNVNSASTLNLRGLGPDATLTLLNGHRLPYEAANSGIDISAIPLAALDRIEIVPDGASAIYGSDAVGGVANVLLRRDYDGLAVSARIAGATDGGGVQQQYDAVTGRRWSDGGVMGAIDYGRSTAIDSRQRDYTAGLSPDATLLPRQRHVSGIVAGHQRLGDTVELSLDALYSHRTALVIFPLTNGDYRALGQYQPMRETSWAVSPKLAVDLPAGWTATLSGTYGRDISQGRTDVFIGGARSYAVSYRYNNSLATVEGGVEGPLFAMPGGDARLAAGAGYRRTGLAQRSGVERAGTTSITGLQAHRSSYYGYGELFLPLVGADQAVPWLHSVSATAAVRYEDYPGIARLATPKLGLIYAPTSDLDLKLSWGRSFKAPTLFRQNQLAFTSLVPAAGYGGPAAPATVLLQSGGNAALKPERAESWTASVVLHPRVMPDARLELSYYHIRYRDRVAIPINSSSGVLAGSAFADIIQRNPSMAAQAAAIASAASGLTNLTSGVYDPSTVVAIIDNRYQNVSAQRIQGVDVAARYDLHVGRDRLLTASVDASYLDSRQVYAPGEPEQQLAGTIFQAPHVRARGGIVYSAPGLSLAATLNYIGSVDDRRYAPDVRVKGMLPLDLTAVYRLALPGTPFDKIDLTLSVLNLFNDKPSRIRNRVAYYPTYDSTNYSAIGRFVSLTVAKSF